MSKTYDLVIVGGGISGCALLYEAARYSDIKRIALIEKYGEIGALNTKGSSNSQTIHFGDIETNYTLQKARITKKTGKMVERYCLRHGYQNRIIFSHQKMALGVGDEEVDFMLNRLEEFSDLFPNLEAWDKDRLKELEPAVVYDRDGRERLENIVGIGSQNEWTTVDYGAMAMSLVENAKKEGKEIDIYLNTKVESIKRNGDKIEVEGGGKLFEASFVTVNAGAHSLLMAQRMGYGMDLSCLPIAGSFYMSKKKILEGKVYMVQNPKLPFAALHGDPDILASGHTRFGPTALVLPKLERYKGGTYLDFWESFRADGAVLSVLGGLFADSDIRSYIFKNFLFETPYLNVGLFVRDARKIVPSLRAEDIEYALGFGGVRPQVINKKEKRLMLGEASINSNEGVIFNMTPSPGATSCLGNGERDLRYICSYLGSRFDEERFGEELFEGEYCPVPSVTEEQKYRANSIREAIRKNEENYFKSLLIGQGEVPNYWEKPYDPWVNKREYWSM